MRSTNLPLNSFLARGSDSGCLSLAISSIISSTAPHNSNVAVKILRSAFAQARRDGLVDVNEAERVTLLKRRDRFQILPNRLLFIRGRSQDGAVSAAVPPQG